MERWQANRSDRCKEAKIKSKIFRYQNKDIPLTWICKAPKYTGQEWITYEELLKARREKKKKEALNK